MRQRVCNDMVSVSLFVSPILRSGSSSVNQVDNTCDGRRLVYYVDRHALSTARCRRAVSACDSWYLCLLDVVGGRCLQVARSGWRSDQRTRSSEGGRRLSSGHQRRRQVGLGQLHVPRQQRRRHQGRQRRAHRSRCVLIKPCSQQTY